MSDGSLPYMEMTFLLLLCTQMKWCLCRWVSDGSLPYLETTHLLLPDMKLSAYDQRLFTPVGKPIIFPAQLVLDVCNWPTRHSSMLENHILITRCNQSRSDSEQHTGFIHALSAVTRADPTVSSILDLFMLCQLWCGSATFYQKETAVTNCWPKLHWTKGEGHTAWTAQLSVVRKWQCYAFKFVNSVGHHFTDKLQDFVGMSKFCCCILVTSLHVCVRFRFHGKTDCS